MANAELTVDCRARLVQAATAAFLESGYGASVERIAALAGVARQTVYNHFPGKAELFTEVVNLGTTAILVTLDPDGLPLRERLVGFARRYSEKVLSGEGLAFFRTVAAETPRFPELARAFYENGPGRTSRRLATVLEQAMQRGELRRDDAGFAADMLLSMLTGSERTRRLFFEIQAEPDPGFAERIVDLFLLAFAPAASPRSPQ